MWELLDYGIFVTGKKHFLREKKLGTYLRFNLRQYHQKVTGESSALRIMIYEVKNLKAKNQ